LWRLCGFLKLALKICYYVFKQRKGEKMAKREWVGTYELAYEEWFPCREMWIPKVENLGRCLCVDEACEKAMNFIVRENLNVKYDTMFIVDGWKNKFYAVKR